METMKIDRNGLRPSGLSHQKKYTFHKEKYDAADASNEVGLEVNPTNLSIADVE
jgi:hypothetical protein